jgi:hypothetical protein
MGARGDVLLVAQFENPSARDQEPAGPLAFDWRIVKTNPPKSPGACTLTGSGTVAGLQLQGRELGKHVVTVQFTATDTRTGRIAARGDVDVEFIVYATIRLVVRIDQPRAGSRIPCLAAPLDVGHAGWEFAVSPEEAVPQLVSDAALRRYVNVPMGFYPDDPAKPAPDGGPIRRGSVSLPDTRHAGGFDVEADFSITPDRLLRGLEYSRTVHRDEAGSLQYHLLDFNCADMVMAVARASGVTLPDTPGFLPGGPASNCGDLGEDLRLMQRN